VLPLRVFGFSTGSPIVAGTPFALTVQGVSLPYHPSPRSDPSTRQRIKLIRPDGTCTDPIPSEVSGIACARTSRKLGFGRRSQDVFTVCSTRPAARAADSVTFANLVLAPSSEASEYSVCYCPGTSCADPAQWLRVPGTLRAATPRFTFGVQPATPGTVSVTLPTVAASWETQPTQTISSGLVTAEVPGELKYRVADSCQADAQPSLRLTVQRSAFSSYTDPSQWRIRLLRAGSDCQGSAAQDTTKWQCQNSGADLNSCAPETPTLGPDSAVFPVLVQLSHSSSGSDLGSWAVCFLESASDQWVALPANVAIPRQNFEVVGGVGVGSSTRGVFNQQVFSAATGQTARLSIKGVVWPGAQPRIALDASGSCTARDWVFSPGTVSPGADTDPPLFLSAFSRPSHGAEASTTATVMLAFNEVVQAGDGFGRYIEVVTAGGALRVPTSSSDSSVSTALGSSIAASWDRWLFMGKRLIFSPSLAAVPQADGNFQSLQDGSTYYLRSSVVGALRDIAGNPIDDFDTSSSWSFTARSAGTTIEGPTLLGTIPAAGDADVGCGGPCNGAFPQVVLRMFFSEYVALPTSHQLMTIIDCGDDHDCSSGSDNFVTQVPVDENHFSVISGVDTNQGNPSWVDVKEEKKIAFAVGDIAADTEYMLWSGSDTGSAVTLGSPWGSGGGPRVLYQTPSITTGWSVQTFLSELRQASGFSELPFDVSYDDLRDAAQLFLLYKYPGRVAAVPELKISSESNSRTAAEEALGSAGGPVMFGAVQSLPSWDTANYFAADRTYLLSIPSGAVVARSDAGRLSVAYSWQFTTGPLRGKFQHGFTFPAAQVLEDSIVFDIQIASDALEQNAQLLLGDSLDAEGPRRLHSFAVCLCDEQVDSDTSDLWVEGGPVWIDTEGEPCDEATAAMNHGCPVSQSCIRGVCRDPGYPVHQPDPMHYPSHLSTTYKLHENLRCDPCVADERNSYIPVGRMLQQWQSHSCAAKCDAGCVGPDCYCNGLQGLRDAALNDTALCLPPSLCQDACDAHIVDADDPEAFRCHGVDVHRDLNRCFLIGREATDEQSRSALLGMEPARSAYHPSKHCRGSDYLVRDDSYLHFKKLIGVACTHASDFSQHIGVLHVTDRVEVGMDYVVSPNKPQSVEVASKGAPRLQPDRDALMVIDCGGQCGAAPALGGGVVTPADTHSDETVASWPAQLSFQGLSLPGGRYRLCFCDSDHFDATVSHGLQASSACLSKEQFAIEVGILHVSGVSCLLSDSRLRRASCAQQTAGGLRCNSAGSALPALAPPTWQSSAPAILRVGNPTLIFTDSWHFFRVGSAVEIRSPGVSSAEDLFPGPYEVVAVDYVSRALTIDADTSSRADDGVAVVVVEA